MKLLYALIIATTYATAKPQGGGKPGLGDGMEESVRKLKEAKSAKGIHDYYEAKAPKGS